MQQRQEGKGRRKASAATKQATGRPGGGYITAPGHRPVSQAGVSW